MPRQPFLRLYKKHPGGQIVIGPPVANTRPEFEKSIAHCIMTWPHVEAEMALFLGQLLGTNSQAAVAVFQTLRRSTNQASTIEVAALHALCNSEERAVVSALLLVHSETENDRTAMAHSHFGTYDKCQDIILWMETKDYVSFKTTLHNRNFIITRDLGDNLIGLLSYYKKKEIDAIAKEINDLAWTWHKAILWLRAPHPMRSELFYQLSSQPRIAQALQIIRQRNTRVAQPRRRGPTEGASA